MYENCTCKCLNCYSVSFLLQLVSQVLNQSSTGACVVTPFKIINGLQRNAIDLW